MYNNRVVVYTSGTFDMFHSNHLKMIEYARGLGDLDHTEAVRKMNIDVFVVGDDWVGKYDYLKELGVTVFYFPRGEGASTTEIKKTILDRYHGTIRAIDHQPNPDVVK